VERWWDRQAGGKGGKAWVAEDADGEGIMETADGEVDYRHRHGFRQDRSDLGEFLTQFFNPPYSGRPSTFFPVLSSLPAHVFSARIGSVSPLWSDAFG
jgi:hypothetical protein